MAQSHITRTWSLSATTLPLKETLTFAGTRSQSTTYLGLAAHPGDSFGCSLGFIALPRLCGVSRWSSGVVA